MEGMRSVLGALAEQLSLKILTTSYRFGQDKTTCARKLELKEELLRFCNAVKIERRRERLEGPS